MNRNGWYIDFKDSIYRCHVLIAETEYDLQRAWVEIKAIINEYHMHIKSSKTFLVWAREPTINANAY